MERFIASWGIAVVSGFLVALVAIWWIDPRTPGGTILLIMTVVAISIAGSASFKLFKTAIARFYFKFTEIQHLKSGNPAASEVDTAPLSKGSIPISDLPPPHGADEPRTPPPSE